MRPEGGTLTLGVDTPPQPKKPGDLLKLTLVGGAVLVGVSVSELDVELSELSVFERRLLEEGTRDIAGVA